MDRRKVAATRYVVLGCLERARPKVLEILDTVFSVGFRVVQLHRRQMTGVAAAVVTLSTSTSCVWLAKTKRIRVMCPRGLITFD